MATEEEERRVRWTGRVAAATLGALLAGHTLLETARDALFLANVRVEHLPWMYIAIASIALVVARATAREADRRGLARRLMALQLVAAASSIAFWAGEASAGPWFYYALYVWSAVLAGAMVVTFWTLLGDLFTIRQGKRHFAGIAIGGAAGALLGALAATLAVPAIGAHGLLLLSALLFVASMWGAWRLASEGPQATRFPTVHEGAEGGLASGLRQLVSDRYAARVAMLVVLSSATLTLGDYLFKSVLASEIPPEELSIWLARIYLGLNLLSVAMLGVGVTPFVQRYGVDKALAVLPAAIALAGLGALAGAALVPIIALKAADGTLRHSLHKTATELLFLPMESRLRNEVKGFIDLVGSNAAKAGASVLILGLVGLAEPRTWVALALVLTAIAWAVAALRLRGPYLDVFRRTLAEGTIETRIDYPEMDLASLESLIRALGDRDERAVLASLDLLVERGRSELVPGLILYHPSHRVVARAIEVFADAGRRDVLDYADRLVDHEYAAVRAAIVRATSALAPDRERLEELSGASCPSIALSAAAGLVAHGWLSADEAAARFERGLDHPQPDTRMAIANAAKLHPAPVYERILPRLARDSETEVAREAVRAMCASGNANTRELIELLDAGATRDLVRTALMRRGETALEELALALIDPATPVRVLRHLPRTVAQFASPRALEILVDGLEAVSSGMVRYRILRAMAPLVTGELRLHPDERRLSEELRRTVTRALSLLERQAVLAEGQAAEPARQTAGGLLLIDLVRDKCSLATGRIFLLLDLLYPDEDFESIESGVQSERATERASGIELIENALDRDLGRAIVGLVASGEPATRLQKAMPERAIRTSSYAGAVLSLVEDERSETLRAFALYHAGELGLEGADAAGEAMEISDAEAALSLRERAVALVERLPDTFRRRKVAEEPVPA